ncbi:MAG: hypothetical protein ABJD11_16425 [Gemmatimonadota bacterium]
MSRVPTRWLTAAVAGLAAGSSFTSLRNGFALDDIPIILRNPAVHVLSAPWAYFTTTYWPADAGPALYRPLTVLGFALQWAAGDGAPLPFHLASIVLYAAAALAIFWLARQLLPPIAAFGAAALFAVHPVHVEAVANVVGQPEIIVGLLIPLALGWYLRARNAGPLGARDIVGIGSLYAVALCFKEHALVLPALLVLAECLVVREPIEGPVRVRRLLPVFLALVATLVVFWTVRTTVTGGLVGRDIHPAFRDGLVSTRLLTALGVIPEYMRLLLFPVHLSADYNPQQIPVLTTFDPRAATGLFLLAAFVAIAWWTRRRAPVVAFGILWIGVTLFPVSNLLLPTGILLAERTLFLPSVGMVLAVCGIAEHLQPTRPGAPAARQVLAAGVVAVLVLGGLVRSATRQLVWRDNATLFHQTALDAPLSYKALAADAVTLFESGQEAAGEQEYRRAIELYGQDPNVIADLGDWYLGKRRWADALGMYQRVLALVPTHWSATSRSILCLINLDRLDDAERLARVAAARGDRGAEEKLAYVDKLRASRPAVQSTTH